MTNKLQLTNLLSIIKNLTNKLGFPNFRSASNDAIHAAPSTTMGKNKNTPPNRDENTQQNE